MLVFRGWLALVCVAVFLVDWLLLLLVIWLVLIVLFSVRICACGVFCLGVIILVLCLLLDG